MEVENLISIEKFAGNKVTKLPFDGTTTAPCKPDNVPGSIYFTTNLGFHDWHRLPKAVALTHTQNDTDGLCFQLKALTEYAGSIDFPDRMQIDLQPNYSLDRPDLLIRTKESPSSSDCSWRQMRLGVELQRSPSASQSRLFGHVYLSGHGDRHCDAVHQLRRDLVDTQADDDMAIVTFIYTTIKSAIDDLDVCLSKNGDFLWQLGQRFADDIGPSKLDFAKEFYQVSFRVVGARRRLSALRKAVDVLQRNGLVQSIARSNHSGAIGALQEQIKEGFEPMDEKIQYMKDSFEHLNAMVVDLSSAKRSDAAINLAKSGRALAFAALIYSPASVAIGIFGMDLAFIENIQGPGVSAFAQAFFVCYVPVMLWLLWTLFGKKARTYAASFTT